jgi:hypothetical protein
MNKTKLIFLFIVMFIAQEVVGFDDIYLPKNNLVGRNPFELGGSKGCISYKSSNVLSSKKADIYSREFGFELSRNIDDKKGLFPKLKEVSFATLYFDRYLEYNNEFVFRLIQKETHVKTAAVIGNDFLDYIVSADLLRPQDKSFSAPTLTNSLYFFKDYPVSFFFSKKRNSHYSQGVLENGDDSWMLDCWLQEEVDEYGVKLMPTNSIIIKLSKAPQYRINNNKDLQENYMKVDFEGSNEKISLEQKFLFGAVFSVYYTKSTFQNNLYFVEDRDKKIGLKFRQKDTIYGFALRHKLAGKKCVLQVENENRYFIDGYTIKKLGSNLSSALNQKHYSFDELSTSTSTVKYGVKDVFGFDFSLQYTILDVFGDLYESDINIIKVSQAIVPIELKSVYYSVIKVAKQFNVLDNKKLKIFISQLIPLGVSNKESANPGISSEQTASSGVVDNSSDSTYGGFSFGAELEI